MDSLAYELKNLTLGAGEGSHLTRNQRHRGLQLIARELSQLGYALPSARSLKPKHIDALLANWREAGLSTGTLKNRMGWVRWWTKAIRKTSILHKDNVELGIEKRSTWGGNRARTTTSTLLESLPERMQLALRLQMAFGLRLEESLKFRAETADKGDALALQASWCKGGRARTVPLTHPRQRALLDEVRQVCGDGALNQTEAAKALEVTFKGFAFEWVEGVTRDGQPQWELRLRWDALTE